MRSSCILYAHWAVCGRCRQHFWQSTVSFTPVGSVCVCVRIVFVCERAFVLRSIILKCNKNCSSSSTCRTNHISMCIPGSCAQMGCTHRLTVWRTYTPNVLGIASTLTCRRWMRNNIVIITNINWSCAHSSKLNRSSEWTILKWLAVQWYCAFEPIAPSPSPLEKENVAHFSVAYFSRLELPIRNSAYFYI